VVISFFGDGSANAGYLHESMNLAAIWELPLVFVCNNNMFAISTPFKTVSKTRDIANRAWGYEIPSIIIDGMNPIEVYEKMGPVIEYVRGGNGPFFVELKTYRFWPHSKSDREVYRTRDEVQEWMKRDPILFLENRMKEKGLIDDQQVEALNAKYDAIIEDAVKFAEESPEPPVGDLEKYVYCQ